MRSKYGLTAKSTSAICILYVFERETRFELATLGLEGGCSTTELLPLKINHIRGVGRDRTCPEFPRRIYSPLPHHCGVYPGIFNFITSIPAIYLSILRNSIASSVKIENTKLSILSEFSKLFFHFLQNLFFCSLFLSMLTQNAKQKRLQKYDYFI